MMKLLTSNIGWKIASLLLAVALWFAVAREPELATSISVPIEFKNIPEDQDIGSNIPDRVRIEIRGPSGLLSRDNLAAVAVILDLSDANASERTYTIRGSNIDLPSGVTFYRAVPSQITLRFDRLLTRNVDVHPLYSKVPDGYHLTGEVIQPARVRIRGPEAKVKTIAAVATDPLDLSAVVGAAQFRTHVNVGDPQIRVDNPTPITVKVTLERTDRKTTK